MSGYTGVTVTSNNTFTNVTGNKLGNGTAFTPPYTIPTLSLSSVKSDVTANAGATLSGNICNSF